MKIIIVGCGKVGYALCQQLNEEGHDITLIDKDAERLQSITGNLDIQVMTGNSTSFLVQKEADIENTDLLIAVTNEDEINLITCLIAKKAGNKCRTIARVRNPQYFNEIDYLKSSYRYFFHYQSGICRCTGNSTSDSGSEGHGNRFLRQRQSGFTAYGNSGKFCTG